MNPNPLTEKDFDRIETLLDNPAFGDDAMRLDEIQAMLCAVVSAPAPVLPSVWLAEAFGGEVPGDAPELAELIELLMRLNNDIAAALLADETVAPILYPVDENGDEYDFATWADAYVFGAGLGDEEWYDLAGEHADDLSELLEPMFLLNGMLREDAERHGERWFSKAEEARLVADIQDNLPAIVQTLYNFWRAKRPVATIQRDEPRIGRNDPCPCGSGKKYKQCCGRPDRLN